MFHVDSPRLGLTGPQDVERVPEKVFAVDCNAVNSRYDFPGGHAYFLEDPQGNPGVVFNHLLQAMVTGRVPGIDPLTRRFTVHPGDASAA